MTIHLIRGVRALQAVALVTCVLAAEADAGQRLGGLVVASNSNEIHLVLASDADRDEPYYIRDERCRSNCETFSGGRFRDAAPCRRRNGYVEASGDEEKRDDRRQDQSGASSRGKRAVRGAR